MRDEKMRDENNNDNLENVKIDKNPDRISGKVNPVDKIAINKLVNDGVANTFAEAIHLMVCALQEKQLANNNVSIAKDVADLEMYFKGISNVMVNICNKTQAFAADAVSSAKNAVEEKEFELQEQINRSTELVAEKNTEISALKEELSILKNNYKELDKSKADLDTEYLEKIKLIDELQEELSSIRAREEKAVKEVTKYLTELESLQTKLKEFDSLKSKLENTENLLKENMHQYTVLKETTSNKIEALTAQNTDICELNKKLSSKLDSKDVEIDKLNDEIRNNELEKQKAVNNIDSLSKEVESLNVLKSALSNKLDTKDIEINELKDAIKNATIEAEREKSRYKEELLNREREIEKSIAAKYEEKIDKYRDEIHSYKNKINDLNNKSLEKNK